MRPVPILAAVLPVLTLLPATAAAQPCRIDVVEHGSGWPVPLVELRTTHNVRFVSDNAGVVAFDLPELMGRETWLSVVGHGYDVPADGFGNRGVRLTPTPGGHLTIEVRRRLPAKRLGRITGGGLFGEAQRFGEHADWPEQGILGCDSVQNAVHRGRLFWAWGDTTLAQYPLGIFHMTGARTAVRPLESFEPPVKLPYEYLTDDAGAPRAIAEMPGAGPTWLGGFASLPDAAGTHRLVASYTKIRPPLTPYEQGLCVWNEETQRFDRHRVLWTESDEHPEAPALPLGHPVRWTDEDGKEWLLFGDPFPDLKCAATFEAWSDPDSWQTLTPQPSVPTAAGGESVRPHRGSVAWSAYRGKWVTVFTQMLGKPNAFGEIWYAEADAPTGPWQGAVKVVTHDNHTFYNPRLHPEFTAADASVLLFEGTYTAQFADHAELTPRHDYNQILYRLDLDDPALRGPAPGR